MENQELNNRLATLEGRVAALETNMKVLENDKSHVQDDITKLNKNVGELTKRISEMQSTVSEMNGKMQVFVDLDLPGKVKKQGQKISWLYGLMTALVVLVGYQMSPWK